MYDNITVNSEETIRSAGDTDYSAEDLNGVMFEQPAYAFVLSDEVNNLKLSSNVNKITLTMRSHFKYEPFTSKYVNAEIAKDMYEIIDTFVNKCEHIQLKKTELVILEQPGTWVIYNCRKRYFYNDVESWNSFNR
jgi:hypothetical protein